MIHRIRIQQFQKSLDPDLVDENIPKFSTNKKLWKPVLWIRIRRIPMFLGLLDLNPDPLARGTVPDLVLDPDPSSIKQK
jgi:hypothetical protein